MWKDKLIITPFNLDLIKRILKYLGSIKLILNSSIELR